MKKEEGEIFRVKETGFRRNESGEGRRSEGEGSLGRGDGWAVSKGMGENGRPPYKCPRTKKDACARERRTHEQLRHKTATVYIYIYI